ncbi:BlaI/MecI/CopY family transcriptional regulator [Clostridioides sp. ZZV14-6150]|uniref:BlaI/MecI/CopY family transcriptional regulator n=1 Tax=Clostridioides sp. ZZV14-6150 TaxID=2811493 RepID=UPI001D0F7751|nr:BlaI/MecI/CopY family transcriptional regulator [Clostridioides sp. ZZV14-6150]
MQKISPAELKVMKYIWKKNKLVLSKEIVKAMELEYYWKATTTFTVLKRLINKGFLDSERVKRITYYEIIITEKAYLNFATKQFLTEIHDGSLESLIESLLDTLSEKDIKKLCMYLTKLKNTLDFS